jgi:hypothetical protein
MGPGFAMTMAAVLLAAGQTGAATVRYVDANNFNPVFPYTNWGTAAAVIQEAIDAADPGDQVLVTNGVYEAGGRPGYSQLTNRVAIYKPLTLESVNGPGVTVIKGFQVANQSAINTNGYLSVRCAYLTNGAALIGFTLTNGGVWVLASDAHDQTGGGAWCETGAVVCNCVIRGNSAYLAAGGIYQGNCYDCSILSNSAAVYGGGANGARLVNCSLLGNRQTHLNLGGGGGAYSCALTNCLLAGNFSASTEVGSGGGGAQASSLEGCILTGNAVARDGGGAYGGVLRHCTVASNTAGFFGGGTYESVLVNSTLTGNFSVSAGGGARLGVLTNCALIGNQSQNIGGGGSQAWLVNCRLTENAAFNGGGASLGTMINCLVVSNVAANAGGGAYFSELTNCSVVGNAGSMGGGSYGSGLANSIIYFNTAVTGPEYDSSSVLSYCCTAVPPSGGSGNIGGPPSFADPSSGDFHLQANSPGVDSGFNGSAAVDYDLDGHPRIAGGTVDMGAYEFSRANAVIPLAWLQTYGLPGDGSADFVDSDGDGMTNWQEWICDTNPTNAASFLRCWSVASGGAGAVVKWQSVTTRTYFVQQALSGSPAGISFATLATNLSGLPGTTSYTDTNAPGSGAVLYRVGVAP